MIQDVDKIADASSAWVDLFNDKGMFGLLCFVVVAGAVAGIGVMWIVSRLGKRFANMHQEYLKKNIEQQEADGKTLAAVKETLVEMKHLQERVVLSHNEALASARLTEAAVKRWRDPSWLEEAMSAQERLTREILRRLDDQDRNRGELGATMGRIESMLSTQLLTMTASILARLPLPAAAPAAGGSTA